MLRFGTLQIGLLAIGLAGQPALAPQPVHAEDTAPFAKLAGRWLGQGRLGASDGKTEEVKCRVTYFVHDPANEMRQTIRCASQSGGVEVQSMVTNRAGVLSGTWKELSRDWSGELSGSVTPHGFKVIIKGAELRANMDIIVKNDRQIIEIQFINSALTGLTLILTKG